MTGTDEALEAAIALHRGGDTSAAGAAYDAILADDPGHAPTLAVSAILLYHQGDAEGAIARLKSAIESDPGTADAHNNLANIYRELGREEEALASYRAALAAQPGHVETVCNIATILRGRGETGEAISLFEQIIAQDPGNVEANHNLALSYAMSGRLNEAADRIEACYAHGQPTILDPASHARILVRLGRRDRAIEIMEMHAASRPDDAVVRHELAALRGEPVPRAPDDYVRTHFDNFADTFESRLGDLGYKVPELVGDLVARLCGSNRMRYVADLGCGTGLLGPYLRANAETLIGVDLSPRMLLHAERRGVYDNLVEAELVEFLRTIPEASLDLAAAADTLVYFGALDELFAALAQALRPGGAFAASVEALEEGTFRFLHTGRYSHSADYVARTAAANGLTLRLSQPMDLRQELDQPIGGLLFVLENTGAA